MHELSDSAKRILDVIMWSFAVVAGAMTLDRVAAIVTIAAGLISCACGLIRLAEWRERRRANRAR
jgi:hypothetical protein